MTRYTPGRARPGGEPEPTPEPWWWPGHTADGYWVDQTPTSTAPAVWACAPTYLVAAADGTLVTPEHLCPDLLRWENIGPADGWRGRVVRGFFALLRLWPPPKERARSW